MPPEGLATGPDAVAARILIVAPGWVGDLVLAGSLVRSLRSRLQVASIDMLAQPWAQPLVARMPGVDSYLSAPVGPGSLGLRARWLLGRSLRGRYDWALVLPNSWKSALVPAAARIPKRTGWCGEMRYGLLNDCPPGRPEDISLMVERYTLLVGVTGTEVPMPRLQPRSAASVLARLGLSAEAAPVLALCPGARYGSARRWPTRHFAAIARHYLNQGWSIWLLAAAADASVAADICEQLGAADRVWNLAGHTDLGEVVDLLALARFVVSNDTGPMHIAAALNKAVVGIFGSSSPAHTPPLGQRASAQYLDLECRPCMQRECPLGHTQCLEQLSPQQVIAAAQTLL